MKSMRIFALVMAVVLVLPTLAGADVVKEKFAHKLGIGQEAQSFEHRIDLPENLAAQGHVFTKRALALTDKLVIEREEFAKTYYYVKVRLPKAQLLIAKGTLEVTLETATTAAPAPVVSPCDALKVSGAPVTPTFSWAGLGKYTAITLLEKGSAQTVWERLIVGAKNAKMDEGKLRVGKHYQWAVKQSDECACYSPAAQGAFRLDTQWERCWHCNGQGSSLCHSCNGSGHIVSQGPNGQPVYQVCYTCHGTGRERCTFCNGTGRIEVAVIVPE